MCDICLPDGTMTSCPYCGRLICFDEGGDDDIQAAAAVTAGGGVACVGCVQEIEAEESRAIADEWGGGMPPYGEESL